MARSVEGWVKLYRSLAAGDIGKNGYCLAIFATLMMWANRAPSTIRWKGRPREIGRGSLVVGLRELADHLKFSKETVHRQLRYLASRDTILLEVATEGTLLTILNYDEYQGGLENLRHSVGQDRDATKDTSQPLANRSVGHEPTPNGEVKNKRSKKGALSEEDFQPIKGFSDHPRLVEILRTRGVTTKTQQAWLDAYSNAEAIKQEIFRALVWEETHPNRRKTNFARFVSNWLGRSDLAQPLFSQPKPAERKLKGMEEIDAMLKGVKSA